jgi:dihydroorotase
MITRLQIRKPDDMHVHLREGDMMREVVPHTAGVFGRALVMPNLKNAVIHGTSAARYRDEILRACSELRLPFDPLMTVKLTAQTTTDVIKGAYSCGVAAVKLYPEGVTTNSTGGIRDPDQINPDVFRAMAHNGMVLCVHAEEPGLFSLDRESGYLRHVEKIATAHPNLRIVIEHITSRDGVEFVHRAGPNVAATITVHHLLITLDDVIGDKLNPHNFCKPIAKREADRAALVTAALSGNPKFFLGTDSAPHAQDTKECASGCAGCFTAPAAIELLTEIFDAHGALPGLESFTSIFGAQFYGLGLNMGTITIVKEPWEIPATCGAVVPFMAGKRIGWRVAK